MATMSFLRCALLFFVTSSSVKGVATTKCGGEITLRPNEAPTTVVSPNYPEAYPNNVRCVWLITCTGNSVEITTNHYDVEDYGNNVCPDNFTIATPEPYLNLGCGMGPLKKTHKFGSAKTPFQFAIFFSSDDRIRRVGFSLTMVAKRIEGVGERPNCGRRLRLRQPNRPLTLVSNNWPFSFPASSSCQWTIINGMQMFRTIRVDIVDANLDGHSSLQLRNNVTSIRHAGVPLLAKRTMRFSGRYDLHIEFKSAPNQWYNGRFRLLVSAEPEPSVQPGTLLCPDRGSPKSIKYRQLCDGHSDCDNDADETLSLCQTVNDCGKQKVRPNVVVDRQSSSADTGKARSGSWPWVASVHHERQQQHLADAVLIAPMWLLSSGVVFSSQKPPYRVRLGSKYTYKDEEPHTVVELVAEAYVESSYDGLLLLRLNRSLTVPFNDYINTVCLPYSMSEDEYSRNCVTITSDEFMSTSNQMHQHVAVRQKSANESRIHVRYPQLRYINGFYYTGPVLTCRTDADDRGWKACAMHTYYDNSWQSNEGEAHRIVRDLHFIYQTMLDAEYHLRLAGGTTHRVG